MPFHDPLFPERHYLILNRAVGNEKLFLSKDNFYYFLSLFDKYIKPLANLLSYSLTATDFLLFLRFRSDKEIKKQMKSIDYPHRYRHDIQRFLVQQFSNFFNSYTKAFNKQQQRKGKLFLLPFQRKSISDPNEFRKLAIDIHLNAYIRDLSEFPQSWEYNSYSSILIGNDYRLNVNEVISWFGSVENFKNAHIITAESF